jgi:hypothetical protein
LEKDVYIAPKNFWEVLKKLFFRTNYFDIVGDALTWFKTGRLRACMFGEEREHGEWT